MRLIRFLLLCFSIPAGAFEETLLLFRQRKHFLKDVKISEPGLTAQQVISYLTRSEKLAGFSPNCQEDVELLGESVIRMAASLLGGNITDFETNVLLPLFDASGKIVAGTFHGRTTFYGLYPMCESINYVPDNRERPFEGGYFRVYANAFGQKNTDDGACPEATAPLVTSLLFRSFDMCLPKSCSSAELTPFLRQIGKNASTICYISKVNDNISERHPMFYVVFFFRTLMAVIAVVSLLAGLMDYFLPLRDKKRLADESLSFQLLMAFSIYRSVSEISQTNSQQQEGVIGPIHCLRFFSMSWVVMGHVLSIILLYGANPVDFMAIITDLSTELLTNAFFAVDTFFFMSGLLLSFIWFKFYYKNPIQSMHWTSWLMLYVHRYIRLSAPYFMALFFYTWVYAHMKLNSPRYLQPMYDSDPCEHYWWVNLLYLNNYVHYTEKCFGVAWYLAADMQMFLFAPLLLIPLALRRNVGLLLSATVFGLSTAATVVTIYVMHFPPTEFYELGPNDADARLDLYMMYVYSSPYIRCQVYLIGILTGYLLQTKQKLRVNKILNVLLWLASFALMITVVLGLHNYQNQIYMTLFWRAAYVSLSRVAWGLGLAWTIISCYYGYGGPINAFMSWHIWAPFGRLTYCSYLLHWMVVDFLTGLNTNELLFSNFLDLFTTRVIPGICITFFVSLFWSALFEVPIGKVETLLLGGRNKVKKNSKEALWVNNEEEQDISVVNDEKKEAATPHP